MVLFHILCILVVVATVVQSSIPINELNIEVIEGQSSTWGETLKQNLKASETILSNAYIGYAGKVGSKVPVIGDYVKVVNDMLGSLNDNTWKDALIKTIEDEQQRPVAENKISEIKASITAIQQKLYILDNAERFQENDKSTIVQIIEHEIRKMIDGFAEANSVFRKSPQFALVPLSTVSPIVAIFEPIMREILPALADLSFLSCKYADVLDEYRYLVSLHRLKRIDLKCNVVFGGNIDSNPLVADVMSRPFNKDGYHEPNDAFSGLESKSDCGMLSGNAVCLYDRVGNRNYNVETTKTYTPFISTSYYSYPGAKKYMEEVQFRVDTAFNGPLTLINRTCPEENRRRRQPHPAGFGWWSILLGCGFARNKQSGGRCDHTVWGFKTPECEAYVKIKVDGVKAHRTLEKKGYRSPQGDRYNSAETHHYQPLKDDEVCFAEIFTYGKISKLATITIELWDADSGTDDILLTKEAKVKDIPENLLIEGGGNSLRIISMLRTVYADE